MKTAAEGRTGGAAQRGHASLCDARFLQQTATNSHCPRLCFLGLGGQVAGKGAGAARGDVRPETQS